MSYARALIGIITNTQHDVFQRRVIMGIEEIARARGYSVLVDAYADNPPDDQQITLDYRTMSGVLSIADATPTALLRQMRQEGIPVSLVSHYVPELPIPTVIADNATGIEALVRHVVVECQRQRLVYIRGLCGQLDSAEREAAFRREIMRHNLDMPEAHFLRGDFDPRTATASLQALLAQNTNFDAVIAADYLMGIAAVETLRNAGLHVPEDVAVVGFGDGPEAEAAGLTTVAADVVEQGRRAARQLISQIEGLRIAGTTLLSVALVVRQTGCPPV